MGKDIGLGKRIAWLRTNHGLEQKSTAAAMGILYTTYQKYEYGNVPSRGNVEKILKYYACAKSWLLTGEGVPYPERPQEQPNNKGGAKPYPETPDLPTDELDKLLEHLKKLSKVDRKRIISALIVTDRRGGIDAVLLKFIYAVMKEFIESKGKSELGAQEFMISITIETIYNELQKTPTRDDLMALLEAIDRIGRLFPGDVPLTPHEQAELFLWKQ